MPTLWKSHWELQMSYQEAYEEKFVYDDLIDLVIEKRFDESP